MAQRIGCPLPEYDDTDRNGEPVYYLDLPDEWIGEHAQRRDNVVEATAEKGIGNTLRNFMVALALLDSWHLPGLSMEQVKKGEVQPVPLELITWVSTEVLSRYAARTTVPKGSSVPLSALARIAETEKQKSQESTDGDSEGES